MGKQIWKPGNMLYPLPAVMVSAADQEGESGILTVAWTGTVCTNPAMMYISVRPERHTYPMIRKTGEFVVNLTTEKLARAADWCGVRSGKDIDKWKAMHLTKGKASKLAYAPLIEESPVNIECKVREILELGSHHMFLAEVSAVVRQVCLCQTGTIRTSLGAILFGAFAQPNIVGMYTIACVPPVQHHPKISCSEVRAVPRQPIFG